MKAVGRKSYEQLLKAHLADYQALFRRVSLDLGRTEAAKLPTDERIRNFATGNDPDLAALTFQYGRYLLIASSRAGGQPANLQGIWNEPICDPAWGSKWTVNINTEMNYWPAEVGQPLRMHRAAVRPDRGLRGHRPQDGAGALRRAAAGCCITTPTSGAARRRSTTATTASGPPAAPGCASICGNITCSLATRSSWRERPIR